MLRVIVFLAAITLCAVGQSQTFMESSIGDAGEFPCGSFVNDSSGTTFNRIIGDASDGIDSWLITVTNAAGLFVEDVSLTDTVAFVVLLGG